MKLLLGYYMVFSLYFQLMPNILNSYLCIHQNLNQNPRTLLPKFFGLYCYQCNSKNVRMVVMNNLLPSSIKLHEKYDLKGSTYKRKVKNLFLLTTVPKFITPFEICRLRKLSAANLFLRIKTWIFLRFTRMESCWKLTRTPLLSRPSSEIAES